MPKPSELWPELERFDAVVMKALSRDADQRFQSADEFAEALEGAVGSGRVAKTREVAEVVRDLDAEKLQDERERVRDAIKMLGSTDIGNSIVPMPREGNSIETQTFVAHGGTGSHVHGTVSGVLNDGTPVVIRRASESDALKWFVMALAIIVFMYAGFLVFQLLRPPAAPGPALDQAKPAAVEPAGPSETDSAPAEASKADEATETEPRGSTVHWEPRARHPTPSPHRNARAAQRRPARADEGLRRPANPAQAGLQSEKSLRSWRLLSPPCRRTKLNLSTSTFRTPTGIRHAF